jgi:hypothetical protein
MARRRFQRGGVYKNRTGTLWLGSFVIYEWNQNGVERRKRKQVVLGLTSEITKREAWRRLQPYLDAANRQNFEQVQERKSTESQ